MDGASLLRRLLGIALLLASGVAGAQSPWSGFYAGLQLGAGSQKSRFEDNNATRIWSTPEDRSSTTTVPGIQLGFNWVHDSLLLGLEADFNGSTAKNSATLADDPCPSCAIASVESKISWFSTLRARAGFLAGPNSLLYVTGGVAYAKQKFQVSLSDGTNSASAEPTSGTINGSVFGAGVEHKLSPRTSLRAEYLAVKLDRQDTSLTSATFGFTDAKYSVTTSMSLLRVGVNWAF